MEALKAAVGASLAGLQAADLGAAARLNKAGGGIWRTGNQPRLDILGKNGLLLEAYSGGSWWDAELIRKVGSTYRIHYDNFTASYDEELPAKFLRLRSRKATVDDCSDILEVGVDITVFAPHPHALLMTGCASRSSAWYDARILKVFRRPHLRACHCKFVVEFYEVKLDHITKAWDLEHRQLLRGSRTIGIRKICVLQRQLRGSLEELLEEVQLSTGESMKTFSIDSGPSQCERNKSLCKYFAADALKAQETVRTEPSESKPDVDAHLELSLTTPPEVGMSDHPFDCWKGRQSLSPSPSHQDRSVHGDNGRQYVHQLASTDEFLGKSDQICKEKSFTHWSKPRISEGKAQTIRAGPVPMRGIHQEGINCTSSQPGIFSLRGSKMEKNHRFSGSRCGFSRRHSPRLNRQGNLASSQIYKPLESKSSHRECHWVYNPSNFKYQEVSVSALPELFHSVQTTQCSGNIARPPFPPEAEKQVQLQDCEAVSLLPRCSEDLLHRSVGRKLGDVHCTPRGLPRTSSSSHLNKVKLENSKLRYGQAVFWTPVPGEYRDRLSGCKSRLLSSLSVESFEDSKIVGRRCKTLTDSNISSMTERPLEEMHKARLQSGSLSDAQTWPSWPKGTKELDPLKLHSADFSSGAVKEEPALSVLTLDKWWEHEGKSFTKDVKSVGILKCTAGEDYLTPMWQDFNDMLQDREDVGSRAAAETQATAAECQTGRRVCTKNHHNFLFNESVGLVCTNCALVGREIGDMVPEIDPRPSCGSKLRKQTHGDKGDGENACISSKLPIDKVSETGEAVVERPNFTLGLIPELAGLLHQHQREGFYFLWRSIGGAGDKVKELGGCILAHAPGTGKSLLVISFLKSYLQVNPDRRTLIIAPKSMLRPWEREFEKWKVDISIFILNTAGKTHQDKEDTLQVKSRTQLPNSRLVLLNRLAMLTEWRGKKSVLITTYSMFSKLIDDPGQKFVREEEVIRKYLLEVPDLLILDEGHFARNEKTKVRRSLMSIKTKLRILLSGTLFQNNFTELFNTLYLVRPGFIEDIPDCDQDGGSSPCTSAVSSFHEVTAKEGSRRTGCTVRIKGEAIRNKLFGTKSDMDVESRARRLFNEKFGRPFEIGQAEGSSAVQIGLKRLTKLTKSFVHYHSGRKVLSNLPELREFAVLLRPNMKQQRLLKEVPYNMTLQAETSVTSICIHPILYSLATSDAVAFPKADPEDGVKTLFVMNLVELCQPRGEKVLIFCMQTRPLRLLRNMFAARFGWLPGKEVVQVDGSMNLDERQESMDMLNSASNSVKVMLASTKACGEGVSLTGASRLIFLDIEWNPAIYRQAISRAFRIGQKKKVFVYRLIGSQTLEERRYNTAEWKDWVATRIIHATGKSGGEEATEFGTPSLCEDRVLQSLINRSKADQWISTVVKQKSAFAF